MESVFRMIDVGGKRVTRRQAIACGTIHVSAAFARIRDKTMPKGDVLAMAEVAGIMGAKKTPEILPMCHLLPLDQVTVDFENDEASAAITVYCQVAAHAKTGVEMEALQGASAALLSIWDLTKGVEPALEVSGIRLLYKEGGKTGIWVHPEGIPDWLAEQMPAPEPLAISEQPLDINKAYAFVSDPGHGAFNSFIGAVRDRNLGKDVEGVSYDVFEALAVKTLQDICKTIRDKQDGTINIFIGHVKGRLPVGGSAS